MDRDERAEAAAAVPLLSGDKDNFNGVIIRPQHYSELTPDQFQQRLAASLEGWRGDGKRGVWVKIPLSRADLVPIAAKLGFAFHHAHSDYVMMTKWLPVNEESTLPLYATHNIGVAGCVINDRNEVLLVQEKWLRNIKIRHWKLPGGVAEPGEDLWQTAIRETKEETGVRTEFVAMLTFRHMHEYRWGTSDIYFSCLLRPLNSDITINPSEIADATWMDVDAYLADPETFPTNRMILQAYKDGVERGGVFVKPTVFPHFLPNRRDMAMYKVESCDLKGKSHDESCDQSGTEHGDRDSTDTSTTPRSNM